MIRSSLLFVLVNVFLTACSNVEHSRNGTSLEVFPVEYSLLLKLNENNLPESKVRLREFIEKNRGAVLSQVISIETTDKESVKFSKYVRDELVKIGVSNTNILDSSQMNGRFNFGIKVIQHKVGDRECKRSSIQSFYFSGDGCFTENARWKSMVSPDRMLPSTLNAVQE